MKFGVSSHDLWRQRGIGSFLSLLLLLGFYLTGFLPLHGPQLVVVFVVLPASYLLGLFARDSRSPIAWPIYLCEGVVIALLIQETGKTVSPMLALAYSWMVGAALILLLDGFRPTVIFVLALVTASVIAAGSWGGPNFWSFAVINTVAIMSMVGSFLTLNLERRIARTDTLLPMVLNRSAGIERLEDWVRAGEAFYLAFVDLGNFKEINDTYGHRAGDDVLLEVAQRLRSSVRTADIVMRYGGDEFIIATKKHLPQLRLEKLLAEPIGVASGEIRVWADIGRVLREPGDDLEQLLHRADELMYTRKRLRKNRSHDAVSFSSKAGDFYAQEMH